MIRVALLLLGAAAGCGAAEGTGGNMLKYTMKDIDGHDVDLAAYLGKVVMIVNVASKCGFTPQYEGLEKIYELYKDRGFVILGFPSNDFLWQEPGDDAAIKSFCSTKYGVTFPMFAKIRVRGKDKAPLYADLTSKAINGPFGGGIKWNFTKFLLDRHGTVIGRFGPSTPPTAPEVLAAINKAVEAKPAP